jgi:hypothetical protein
MQFMIILTQRINQMSIQLNLKTSGQFPLTEFVDGNTFFPNPALSSTTAQTPTNRQEFIKVIDFGALPNAGIKTVPHGITIDANTSFTQIYATATEPNSQFIPIPFSSPTALIDNIEILVDTTDVIITTAINYSAFTICYVVLKYIKQ